MMSSPILSFAVGGEEVFYYMLMLKSYTAKNEDASLISSTKLLIANDCHWRLAFNIWAFLAPFLSQKSNISGVHRPRITKVKDESLQAWLFANRTFTTGSC
jgi:hypothetical protein